jgi:hypothetical protein
MNKLIIYDLPQWLPILFGLGICLPFLLIFLFVKKQEQQKNHNTVTISLTKKVVLFYAAYILYIFIASKLGLFNVVSLPPKVLLLTTFPYAILLFMVFDKMKPIKLLCENASASALIRLHAFRVVGLFFILLAFQNTLPKPFAFIAGAGDIIAALTSLFVASRLEQQKKGSTTLALAWNIFGTIDILFTAIAANVLTKWSIDSGSMGVDVLAAFPFCIIPAFAPPTILFLHWHIFKKLKKP